MTNLVLCGGSGTRLWPVSRSKMPKQFVKIFDGKSLFQKTIERNSLLCEQRVIVANVEHYFLARDQMEETGISTHFYLLEPMGRNTAPAIAMACMALPEDETVLVTPSDHIIRDLAEYRHAVEKASRLADEGNLVTFGIEPAYPETGYGYIEQGEALLGGIGHRVHHFHEKPDRNTAEKYLQQEGFFWNSGMFCFKAGNYLQELERCAPEIYDSAWTAYRDAKRDDEERRVRISYESMERIPEESIDHAVMERSHRVAVVPSTPGWSDLGSFDALYRELPRDREGNTIYPGHLAIDSRNNLIFGEERTIATIDVEDLMIVDTGDALLVAKRESAQKVREVVKKLREQGSELPDVHLTVHRPWGTYTVLEEDEGYKIKRIVVKPGKRLSLQKHFHRSEHWIVVSGTATVSVGGEVKLVRPNESTYIKIGEEHRLANEGKIPVVLIEAQVGEYTGEDDILRLDDDYRRE